MAQDSLNNFKLFGHVDFYGSAAPQLEPDYEPETLPFRSPKKDSGSKKKTAKKKSSAQKTKVLTSAERKAQSKSIKQTIIIVGAIILIFCSVSFPMYLHAKLDEKARAITSVETQIEQAKSEYVRLQSTLSGLVAIDKLDDFAVNNLGMVKLDNYKITYLPSDDDNKAEISGGKSYDDSQTAGSKLSKLKEYLF